MFLQHGINMKLPWSPITVMLCALELRPTSQPKRTACSLDSYFSCDGAWSSFLLRVVLVWYATESSQHCPSAPKDFRLLPYHPPPWTDSIWFATREWEKFVAQGSVHGIFGHIRWGEMGRISIFSFVLERYLDSSIPNHPFSIINSLSKSEGLRRKTEQDGFTLNAPKKGEVWRCAPIVSFFIVGIPR